MPKNSKKSVPLTRTQKMKAAVKRRTDAYLERRPHRSFRRTRQRDYRRSLQLPGYFAFTHSVNKTLWQHKKIFLLLALCYAILTGALIGIGSQSSYTSSVSSLTDSSSQALGGNIGQFGQTIISFASVASSGFGSSPTESQQIYIVLLGLLVWLTTVWLLRNLVAGHKVRLRDGLYNAGAPIVPTAIVAFAFVLQLIPLGLAVLGYSSANASGLLTGGVEAMLFWIVAGLLTIVSLYWTTSTFFALIVVTLPGMYPWQALRTAGDMMVGRRVRFLLRIVWMFLVVAVGAMIVLIPSILIDNGLVHVWAAVGNVPVIPVMLLLFSVSSFIWMASYIYLLYRKVIDDDAKPA